MIKIYDEIIDSEGEEDWIVFLTKLNVHKIFKPLFDVYKDQNELMCITKYIMYCFSLDSDMLISDGKDWMSLSLNIAKKAGIQEKDMLDVVNLKSISMIEAIENFLDYQNDEKWTQYCHYRELRRKFLKNSLAEETDDKSAMTSIMNAETLLEKMEALQSTFVRKNAKLRAPVLKLEKVKEQYTVEELLKMHNARKAN